MQAQTEDCLRAAADAALAASCFSGAVRVSLGPGVAVEPAHGYADVSLRVANRVDTRFRIASGTKLCTAPGIGVSERATPANKALLDGLRRAFPNLRTAYVLDWIPEQSDALYRVLVDARGDDEDEDGEDDD